MCVCAEHADVEPCQHCRASPAGAGAGTTDDWWTPERVKHLRDATNDTAFDCDPACDSYGHTKTCDRRNEPSFMLARQQAENVELRAELLAATSSRQALEQEAEENFQAAARALRGRDEWAARARAAEAELANLRAALRTPRPAPERETNG
jgi:hypothetical protein